MAEYTYVGKRSQPEDGLEKVTGKARYVGDYILPEMLIAKILRSPLPHATIRSLDTAPALQVPGVVAVITAEDFVDHGLLGWPVKDAFALAWKKVRHVGDPVAAVAAESEEAALAGIRAIRVEYAELPAVGDIHHALDTDAPVIPDTAQPGLGNLTNTHRVRNGDPDPILAACEVIHDETYTFKHQEHAYLETEGALAIPEPDGGLTVYANDQSPFINRDNLVMLLGLPVEKVRVIQPYVGGSFGGKDDIGYQCAAQAGALALKAQRPVRLTLTRTESFLASYKREAMEIHIRLGATPQGELKAAKVELLVDSGGYASMTPLACWRATVHAAGTYRYEAVHVDAQSVYTNNGYSGAMRGFGNPQSIGAIEQAIDELAFHLKTDPIDFRLKNILRQGDLTMTGNPVNHPVNLEECFRIVRQHSDWDAKRRLYAAPQTGDLRRGIGVACYFHGSSLGGEGADYATTTLKIEEDNSITLTSGLTDYGQGSRTIFMLIAAEQLGVNIDRLHMLRPDTQTGIESGPTVASRSTMVGGNATHVAAQRLNQVLRWAAANALHCQPAQIHRDGELFIGASEEPLTFDEVARHAREMGLSLYVQGKWQMPIISWDFDHGKGVPYVCYTFGAQVIEVETSLSSGQTRVLGVWAAHDGGRIIFPTGALGQMYGGVVMGIGYALTEGLSYANGYPQKLNFHDYRLPTARDLPPIDCNFVECDYPDGPYGAHNLAEPMMLSVAPAIANALFQATGKRWRTFPLNPRMLLTGEDAPVMDVSAACRRGLGLEGRD
ncbi:MAG TPA: xanthine dehydrogenase family protein molybdopterin-binding subunit [Anaerolineaceae bacterium]